MSRSTADFSAACHGSPPGPHPVQPLVLALFQKRIEGDDALLQLARHRFQEAGLGTEMHAASPEELEWMLGFRPASDTPIIVHLPREISLFQEQHRRWIEDFSTRFAGRVLGYVIHDQAEMASGPKRFGQAVRELERCLAQKQGRPLLFIEYAFGHDPDLFLRFFHSLKELPQISICVDIGHLGLWQVRKSFPQPRPGLDVCALASTDPPSAELIAEIDRAVGSARPMVVNFIRALGRPDKPIHFHLHDGHPLSKQSLFGVSDHLSFLEAIRLDVPGKGRQSLGPMFGPRGLADVVAATVQTIGADRLSFTLEIHPVGDRLPLDEAADLFRHWQDKTNAEKMNHWLAALAENHRLLSQIIRRVKTETVNLIDLEDEDDVQPKY